MDANGLISVFTAEKPRRANSFLNHRHSAFEISLILQGSGNYLIGGRTFPIGAGDVFVYHTNEAHCITDSTGEDPMRLLSIKFEPRYFWTSFEEAAYLQSFFLRSRRDANRVPVGTELNGALRELMLETEREDRAAAVGSGLIIRSCVLKILILLTREEEKYASLPVDTFLTDQKLRRIADSTDYICAHFREALTLEQLAAQADLSRTYYCTVFKRLTGITPWDYVNLKRIDAAMEILREENCSVLDTAVRCGFNNTANFNRIFRKYTGLTPHEFRKIGS